MIHYIIIIKDVFYGIIIVPRPLFLVRAFISNCFYILAFSWCLHILTFKTVFLSELIGSIAIITWKITNKAKLSLTGVISLNVREILNSRFVWKRVSRQQSILRYTIYPSARCNRQLSKYGSCTKAVYWKFWRCWFVFNLPFQMYKNLKTCY